jgi:hypothetical protein
MGTNTTPTPFETYCGLMTSLSIMKAIIKYTRVELGLPKQQMPAT